MYVRVMWQQLFLLPFIAVGLLLIAIYVGLRQPWEGNESRQAGSRTFYDYCCA